MNPRFFESAGPLPLVRLLDGLSVDAPEGRVLEDEIQSVAPLASSQRGDVCFLEGKAHIGALETAGATACFVTPELAPSVGKHGIVPLISKTPKAHFGRALERLFRIRNDVPAEIAEDTVIHPTAIIGPGCRIGAGTRVGAYTVVEFAEIGEGCDIQAQAVIGGSGMGSRADEHGVLDLPHVGIVRIGDRVRVGSQTCIDRGFVGDTVIGDDVKIDNLVQIAHNCRIGARTAMASFVGISGSCMVGEDVRMGGQVGLADHLTVGDGATLLARSGFMHDVPAGETWMGTPAQPVRQHMREVAMLRKMTSKKKG